MHGPSSLIWIIAIGVTAVMIAVHVAIWFAIRKLGGKATSGDAETTETTSPQNR